MLGTKTKLVSNFIKKELLNLAFKFSFFYCYFSFSRDCTLSQLQGGSNLLKIEHIMDAHTNTQRAFVQSARHRLGAAHQSTRDVRCRQERLRVVAGRAHISVATRTRRVAHQPSGHVR